MRSTLLILFVGLGVGALAQDPMRSGVAYSKSIKGVEGDGQLVANATTDLNGMPVLFMM